MTLTGTDSPPDFGHRLASIQGARARFLEQVLSKLKASHRTDTSKSLGQVRKVLVILAAPRSGSSLLYWALSHLQGVRCLDGELTPFYRISSAVPICEPYDGFHASQLTPPSAMRRLREELLVELLSTDLAAKLVLRIQAQWPEVQLDLEEEYQEAVASVHRSDSGNTKEICLDYLTGAARRLPIQLQYYDGLLPHASSNNAPPSPNFLIEEPPFVLPRRPAPNTSVDDWLVIKTSTDTARAHWLRLIFGDADVRFIHLVRNPAASINGLIDGWRHHGFFSDNVFALLEAPLAITGYSESGDWAKHWWKFDRPRGWEAFTKQRLSAVARFQWAATNEAAMCSLHSAGRSHLRLNFEDIAWKPAGVVQTLGKIATWLGMDTVHSLPAVIPFIQSTSRPSPSRWQYRPDEIAAECSQVAALSKELGYPINTIGDWP